jgi:CheY-like chemotaxis protein
VVVSESVHERDLTSALSHKKLLLVCSTAKMYEFLNEHGKSWGLLTEYASSTKAAMTALLRSAHSGEPFDFVGVDAVLQDGDGFNLIRQIRANSDIAAIPAFITALGDIAHDQQALRWLSVHAVLRKPISGKVLKYELAALMGYELTPVAEYRLERPSVDKFEHLRVLVAEDNAVNRMVIKGLLSKLKIQPELVENGLLAFHAVRKAVVPYDVILMDCEMPEMDGFQATRNIREFEKGRNLKPISIVALTAHALQEHRDAVFASGMNHYLSKPVTLDNLIHVFELIVHKKSN